MNIWTTAAAHRLLTLAIRNGPDFVYIESHEEIYFDSISVWIIESINRAGLGFADHKQSGMWTERQRIVGQEFWEIFKFQRSEKSYVCLLFHWWLTRAAPASVLTYKRAY